MNLYSAHVGMSRNVVLLNIGSTCNHDGKIARRKLISSVLIGISQSIPITVYTGIILFAHAYKQVILEIWLTPADIMGIIFPLILLISSPFKEISQPLRSPLREEVKHQPLCLNNVALDLMFLWFEGYYHTLSFPEMRAAVGRTQMWEWGISSSLMQNDPRLPLPPPPSPKVTSLTVRCNQWKQWPR